MKSRIQFFCSALLVLSTARVLLAGTVSWTNASGGNWSVKANWNPNQIPGSSDAAVIAAAGRFAVNLDTNVTVDSLTLGGTSGQQTFATGSNALTLNHASVVGSNGVFALGGGVLNCGGLLTVGGQFNWNAGAIGGGSVVSIMTNGLLILSGSEGVDYDMAGVLTNAGTIDLAGGNLQLDATNGAGQIINRPGALVDFQTDVSIDATNATASGPLFFNSGTVQKTGGTGVSAISPAFTNSGALEVETGTVSLNGAYSLTGGTLNASINSLLSFGVINLSSNSPGLDGALVVTLENGFSPALGDAFSVVTYNSLFGAFTDVSLPANLNWETNYGPDAFSMTIVETLVHYTWTGDVSTNWSDPGNWMPEGVPGATDSAIINGGTVTLPADLNVAVLTVASGQLQGNATLTGTLNWSGGQLTPGASLTVATNGILNIDGEGVGVLGALTNLGTVNWRSGYVQVFNDGTNDAGVIWNEAGGWWNVECDQNLYNYFGGELFHNAGTLRKTADTGTTGFNLILDDEGLVDAQEGTLFFGNGGYLGGKFQAETNGAIYFAYGTYTMGPSTVFQGPGPVQFTDGQQLSGNITVAGTTMNVTGGQLNPGASITVATNGVLNISGGYLEGALTNNGALSWSGGTLLPGASIFVRSNGVLNITGGDFDAALTDAGTIIWSNAGLDTNGSLTITSNAILDIVGGGMSIGGVVTNEGTVKLEAGGVNVYYGAQWGLKGEIWNETGAVWDIEDSDGFGWCCYDLPTFHNAGTLVEDAGTTNTGFGLYLDDSGTVGAESGSLYFNNGGYLGGIFQAEAAGAIYFAGGTYTLGAATSFAGPGPVEFLDNQQLSGNITVTGTTMTLAGGQLIPGASITVATNGVLNLTGGYLDGALTNKGTLNWSGGTLLPGASVVVSSNGVLNVTGGDFDSALTDEGTIIWSNAGLDTNGSLTITTNAILDVVGGGMNVGGVVTNEGTVNLEAGSVNVYYGAEWGLKGEIWNETGAVWDIQDSDGLSWCCFDLPTFHNAGTLLENAGTTNTGFGLYLDDRGTVDAESGSLYFNNGGYLGGLFQAEAAGAIYFAGGTYTLGSATSFAGPGPVEFINNQQLSGNITVTGTTMTLAGGQLNPGASLTVATNGVVNILGGNLEGAVTNKGTINWSGGQLNQAVSLLVAPGAILNDSNASINGTLTVQGTMNWSGGQLNASGWMLIATNGVLDIDGGGMNIVGALTNEGTVNWQSGYLTLYNDGTTNAAGAIWNETGALWDLECDQNLSAGFGSEEFSNAGTLRKTADTNDTSMGVVFENTGTVDAQVGIINFDNGGFLGGEFKAESSGAIYFDYGTFTLGATTSFQGPGPVAFTDNPQLSGNNTLTGTTMTFSGGELNPGASLTVAADAVLNVSGGTIDGTLINQGSLNWSYGRLNSNGSLTIKSNANFNFASGDLAGAVTDLGKMNWSGGELDAGGSLTVTSYAVLNLVGGGLGIFGALTNDGTVNWQSGYLNVGNDGSNYTGAVWNEVGAIWNIDCDSNISVYFGDEQFYNAGTIVKNADTNMTSFGISLDNSGLVEAKAGILAFYSGGHLGGSFQAASAGAIYFDYGIYSLGAAASFQGPGPVEFMDSAELTGNITLVDTTMTLAGGQLDPGSSLTVAGDAVLNVSNGALEGAVTNLGTLNWSYGTLAAGASLVVASNGLFNFSGGDLAGTVTAKGTMNWTGGSLDADSSLTIESNAVLNFDGDGAGVFGSLTNEGTVNWTTGNITVAYDGSNYTGSIWNEAGALWDIGCDSNMNVYFGDEQFHNEGLLRKSAGTGTTYFGVILDNSGTVDMKSGTLSLDNGSSLTGGTLNFGISGLTNYGQINLSGNPASLDGAIGAYFENGFYPSTNDSFAVVNYGSETGVFTSTILPSFLQWQTNYEPGSFVLGVLNITPLVNWNPAPITYGTPLGADQFNAVPVEAGTFVYSPAAGTVLDAGANVLTAVFTPSDTNKYSSFVSQVDLIVMQAPLTLTANSATRPFAADNPTFTGSISGVTNSDNLSISFDCSANAASPSGDYSIVPVLIDPNNRAGNYAITTVDGTLTVTAIPPNFTQVATQFVMVGKELVLTNMAVASTPPVTYLLGGPVPVGACLDTNGVFSWTPSCEEGTTTNLITVWAVDGSVPPLSNSMTFAVVVGECTQVGLGRTVLQIGQITNVPLTLFTTVGITNLSFTLESLAERFTNWTIITTNTTIGSVTVETNGDDLPVFTVAARPGQSIASPSVLGTIGFTVLPGSSAFVPLLATNITGVKLDGTPVGVIMSHLGRAVVIGQQPLLEGALDTNQVRSLFFYGNPGTNFQLQLSSELQAPTIWSNGPQVKPTNLTTIVSNIDDSSIIYYRALQSP